MMGRSYIYRSTENLPDNFELEYKDITYKSSVIEIRDHSNMLENWEHTPIACLAGYATLNFPKECDRTVSHKEQKKEHLANCPPIELESVIVFKAIYEDDVEYTGRGIGKRLVEEAVKIADALARPMILKVAPFRHKKRDESYLLNFYTFFGFKYVYHNTKEQPVMIRAARSLENGSPRASGIPKGENKVYEVRSNG